MPLPVEIRYARPEDVHAVMELVKKSFGEELTKRLIYGSSGFAEYMRESIEVPEALAEIKYIVALTEDRKLAGFTEILCHYPHLFLNYICTDRELNLKGLGSALLKQSLEMVGAGAYKDMTLDVFETNTKAYRWYQGLGFQVLGRNIWWDIPLETNRGKGRGFLSCYPQSKVCQDRFGFSRFQLRTPTRSYDVGMLGEQWYRITEPEILQDKDALAILGKLEKDRRVLAILPDDFSPADHVRGAREIAASIRMAVDCPDLIRNLNQR